MENKFLAVDKSLFDPGLKGLKSLDILVIACIEEYQRNSCECHITNQQFCEMFHEDINAIKRCLKKLEDMNIVTRQTSFVKGAGRGNRQRSLTVSEQWISRRRASAKKVESSKKGDGRLANDEWKGHKEPIKENKKIIKENILLADCEPIAEKRADTAKEGTSPEKNEGFISDDGLPGRRIRDLSEDESKQIQAKIKEGVPYQEIERMYGMRQGTVTVDFTKHWGAFLYARVNGRV